MRLTNARPTPHRRGHKHNNHTNKQKVVTRDQAMTPSHMQSTEALPRCPCTAMVGHPVEERTVSANKPHKANHTLEGRSCLSAGHQGVRPLGALTQCSKPPGLLTFRFSPHQALSIPVLTRVSHPATQRSHTPCVHCYNTLCTVSILGPRHPEQVECHTSKSSRYPQPVDHSLGLVNDNQ